MYQPSALENGLLLAIKIDIGSDAKESTLTIALSFSWWYIFRSSNTLAQAYSSKALGTASNSCTVVTLSSTTNTYNHLVCFSTMLVLLADSLEVKLEDKSMLCLRCFFPSIIHLDW